MDLNHRPHAYQACALTNWAMSPKYGGAERVRTDDLLNANQPLFQLSYGPIFIQQRFFLKSLRLFILSQWTTLKITKYNCTNLILFLTGIFTSEILLRKEVIQPQVPLRLPCYDLVPITNLSLGRCPLAVSSRTSGKIGFHDLTGGVYKARERIQGVVADTPLLAIPASCSRVADCNLN